MAPESMSLIEVEACSAPRVLIAEDEILVRLDLAESIRDLGWEVVEVSSADEAIELLRHPLHFDLLVTDIQMPGQKDGLDLARHVRERFPDMKIAIVSGAAYMVEHSQDLCHLVMSKPASDAVQRLLELMKADGDGPEHR
ncbi:response regulator [Rhizobium leguminosarum]|uniref:response regulator n=1 Tax=Rhizobium leguminosarum TaxID=384 RepID=UPI001C95A392|nr:response regulator [Rhizobium leguminosarum]MBY5748258.1 response regulator [Rhizobium leguminosarum]